MKMHDLEERKISVEAAQWLFRMKEEADFKHNAEFIDWLKRSPRHMGEFLFATAALHLASSADPDLPADIDGALEETPVNVASLESRLPPQACGVDRKSALSGWPARTAFAAALLGGVLIFAWWLRPALFFTDTYRTQLGEQRSINLDDGSVLYLNTESRARVAYSQAARDVELIEGEALFVVAQDKERPFRVRSAGVLVEAVGTQFNVRRHEQATTVSVIEGRVNVSPDTGVVTPLAAGEEARISGPGRIAKRALPNMTRALSWRQRRLMFDGTSLKQVAQEFNRYNRSQIRVQGSAVENLQITGTFNADEPHALVNFLRGDASLEIRELGGGAVIASRK